MAFAMSPSAAFFETSPRPLDSDTAGNTGFEWSGGLPLFLGTGAGTSSGAFGTGAGTSSGSFGRGADSSVGF